MTAITIFKEFLLLGCMSFGGPAAHIGFFRRRFVEELKWLSDQDYGEILALCHFLPGPSSSQVGFSIGHRMSGMSGALAAFLGFTTPSFLIMLGLVFGSQVLNQVVWFSAVLHGLKLVAVIVVFDAILSMGTIFCTDLRSRTIAVVTCLTSVLLNLSVTPILCIFFGALLGYFWKTNAKISEDVTASSEHIKRRSIGARSVGLRWLIIFLLLLILLPLLSPLSSEIELFATFYQAGSLVFGGGHVVLPLLQTSLADSLSNEQLLTAYAAAQAVPGPMFTIATYLGGLSSTNTVISAILATTAIFLPGFLLILALQHSWKHFSQHRPIAKALWGINASVVGLLAAAFISLIIPESITGYTDICISLLGIVALRFLKPPIILLIAFIVTLTLIF